MRYIFLLFICLFHIPDAESTHIIGGSISYKFLYSVGNASAYQIRLEVLRDCFNGSPDAPFDEFAHIGIFGNFFAPDSVIKIAFDGISDTLNNNDINNICEYSNICVHRAVYDTIIHIPHDKEGHTLAYQRCCRSQLLQNILNPLQTGMTFFAYIPPVLNNSSPVFKNDFPYAVFSNTPFVYDASATDSDGDSLSYELITPYSGGTIGNAQPHEPPPPPYENVVFRPPYSLVKMLGGYPLTIDPRTGEMTAIPNTVGVFQIGYAVKEFRNGQLIGTTNREFAFVVLPQWPDQNYDIAGTVYVDTSTLDLGKVRIFERDISDDSLHLYEEQEIGMDGSYSFLDIPAGVFYIQAIVDPASQYYDLVVPTYYSSSAFWYEATPMNQCDTSQYFRDIHMVPADLSGGVDSLDGTVVLAGRSVTPVVDLSLLLVDLTGKPVQARITNDDGYFKFKNLSLGTYKIFVDLVNSPINNSNPPVIELTHSKTIQLYLYKDSLSLQMPTSIGRTEQHAIGSLQVYPNPSSGSITAYLENSANKVFSYHVINANGHFVQSGTLNSNQPKEISIADLPAGLYVLKIQNEGYMDHFRILKQN